MPGTFDALPQGNSKLPDVTSVVFPFAGIAEAQLRKNNAGQKQRLTLRTLLPIFVIDENAIIAERSPVLGSVGFDETARKRMFSYLLTGKDDESVIASETQEMANAKVRAQIALIDDLLESLEKRFPGSAQGPQSEEEQSIDQVDEGIERLSTALTEDRNERIRLQRERKEAVEELQRAETQILAIDELLARYRLLDSRYRSDLERLDFVSEGAHFFGDLQEVRCPLCDQPMGDEHRHWLGEQATAESVYEAAKAEAAKILGHRSDLVQAIKSLTARREDRHRERSVAQERIGDIDERTERELRPSLRETKANLDELIERRLDLENIRSDRERVESLRALRTELESTIGATKTTNWAKLSPTALRAACDEIEGVLREWSWKEEGRVHFDEKMFDIEVDGQPRQSHGKGVRAILHAAFVVGLLVYCLKYEKPHPGFVMIDSLLTTYKKGQPPDAPIDSGIEAAFWQSLAALSSKLQIVVLDNKEPPDTVAEAIHYERFAGVNARPGERRGFIPQQEQTTTIH